MKVVSSKSRWGDEEYEDICGIIEEDNKVIRHKDFCEKFYKDIVRIIDAEGYKVKDLKRFKAEIYNFIYTNSIEY